MKAVTIYRKWFNSTVLCLKDRTTCRNMGTPSMVLVQGAYNPVCATPYESSQHGGKRCIIKK
jgi:hypothetical protein